MIDVSFVCSQALLRTEFHAYTVLTIAHRLGTVIDYDRILVMGAGRLVEEGTPYELLRRTGGILSSMAGALGETSTNVLLERSLKQSSAFTNQNSAGA